MSTEVEVEEKRPDPRVEAIELLSAREREALDYLEAQRDRGQGYAPVSRDVADRFFLLYLRGLNTEDIRVLNPGFQLATIVEARVNGLWDRRRAEHDLRQLTEGADAIKRAQLEAALLAGDMIAASAQLNRTRIHKYLASGDERDLGDLAIGSLRQLKECLEILMKATKQDQPRAAAGAGGGEGPLPASTVAPAEVLAHQDRGRRLLELAAVRRASRKAEREGQ